LYRYQKRSGTFLIDYQMHLVTLTLANMLVVTPPPANLETIVELFTTSMAVNILVATSGSYSWLHDSISGLLLRRWLAKCDGKINVLELEIQSEYW